MYFEMRDGASASPRRASSAGFTLVEMIAVLLVIAIGASLSIDTIASFDSHQRAERAARNCVAFSRYARNLAMTTWREKREAVGECIDRNVCRLLAEQWHDVRRHAGVTNPDWIRVYEHHHRVRAGIW